MKDNDSLINKLKIVLAVALGAILMLFALQNMARVELTVLVWTIEARRIVVIALSFLIGFAMGWLIKASRGHRRDDSRGPGAKPTRWP